MAVRISPILFTPENAQKVHEGTKTQTRRIVKPQQYFDDEVKRWRWLENPRLKKEWTYSSESEQSMREYMAACKCPYGTVGDRLWVREAWATTKGLDHVKPRDLVAGFACEYKAGGTSLHGVDKLQARGKWRSSMFMPRIACRTWLELTGVRVERIKSITEEDCKAEGVAGVEPGELFFNMMKLWESINGEGSWEHNPFCWVLSFKSVGSFRSRW